MIHTKGSEMVSEIVAYALGVASGGGHLPDAVAAIVFVCALPVLLIYAWCVAVMLILVKAADLCIQYVIHHPAMVASVLASVIAILSFLLYNDNAKNETHDKTHD